MFWLFLVFWLSEVLEMLVEVDSSISYGFAVDFMVLVAQGVGAVLDTHPGMTQGHPPPRLRDLQANGSNPKGAVGLVLSVCISWQLWSGKEQ